MHDDTAPSSRGASGFTLLEMMITLAVASIVAALAVPNMAPLLQGQRVSMTADNVAAFLQRARQMAIAQARCVRVAPSKTDPGMLEMQRLTRSECVTDVTTWSPPIAHVRAGAGVSLLVETLAGNAPDGESIIFRPNGRLRGNANLATTDDGARVVVAHGGIEKRAQVLVTSSGRVCWISYASAPPPPLMATGRCPKEAL